MVVESRRNEKGNRKGKEDRTQNKVERKKNNETGKEKMQKEKKRSLTCWTQSDFEKRSFTSRQPNHP